MNELPLKEKTAIELKYLGNTHQEISDKLEVPKNTIDDWFRERGKLSEHYREFVKTMNEMRQRELVNQVIETDENILRITTNIMRKVGNLIQAEDSVLGVGDFEKAWKIQRIMRGLPTAFEKQELDATIYESDKVIKDLGLTAEDFQDERLGETTRKIIDHLKR